MGTITINVDDQTESLFREVVLEEEGSGKGRLGYAVTEALKLWINQRKQTEIANRQLALMKKGLKLGKFVFNREELHERIY